MIVTVIDILIYVAFAFFASYLAKKSENYIEDNGIEPTKWDKYLKWFVLFFTVIGGIRYNVGADWISYATMFAYREVDLDANETLWAWFVYAFQHLGLHWMLGMALCMFFQIYFVTKTLQPYRWLLVFIPFVFFGGRYWLDCMNAVRQMVVACGFLWASRFIYDKKIVRYALFVFVASLIHQSALILIPFYFIPNKLQLTKRRVLLISVFAVCVVCGQMADLSGLAEYVETVAGATEYDYYGQRMSEMLQSGYDKEALSFGPMMLSYLLIPLFIIWYGAELKEEYGDTIPYFDLWFNLAFIYACFYFLVCNRGHLFIRPFQYFSLFQMVMGALLLRHLWVNCKHFGIRQMTTLVFCCIVATNTFWDTVKASGKSFECSTYKILFFHQDHLQWLKLL